jgi:hypothetical protein
MTTKPKQEPTEPMRTVKIFARGILGGSKTYPIAGAHPFHPPIMETINGREVQVGGGGARPVGRSHPGHDLVVGRSHKLTLESRYIDEVLKHDPALEVTEMGGTSEEEEDPSVDAEVVEEEENTDSPGFKKRGKKR